MFIKTRLDPFWDMDLDKLFTRTGNWSQMLPDRSYYYENKAYGPVRIEKDVKGAVTAKFDVPGFVKENLEVQYCNDTISVRSSYDDKVKESEKERPFSYKVHAPDLDPKSIEAVCKNGVLTVTGSPLAPEQVTITIK